MDKQIRTEIIIDASAQRVWQVLTDFSAFPSWNPFLVSVEGRPEQGTRLKTTMHANGKNYVFRPEVKEVVVNRSFSWLGSMFVKGIFDGYHYFEIEALAADRVKFIQGERFSGLLSSYILRKIGDETRDNFVRMNNALKAVAERKQ